MSWWVFSRRALWAYRSTLISVPLKASSLKFITLCSPALWTLSHSHAKKKKTVVHWLNSVMKSVQSIWNKIFIYYYAKILGLWSWSRFAGAVCISCSRTVGWDTLKGQFTPYWSFCLILIPLISKTCKTDVLSCNMEAYIWLLIMSQCCFLDEVQRCFILVLFRFYYSIYHYYKFALILCFQIKCLFNIFVTI